MISVIRKKQQYFKKSNNVIGSNKNSQGISSLDKFIKVFKKENNELGLFEELVQFFKEKNISNYITKSSIRLYLKEWISISIALIPLFIALLD